MSSLCPQDCTQDQTSLGLSGPGSSGAIGSGALHSQRDIKHYHGQDIHIQVFVYITEIINKIQPNVIIYLMGYGLTILG